MKALFLDIDGVLQPSYSQVRFEHISEMKKIARKLDEDYPGYMFEAFVSEKKSPLKDDSPFSVESRIYDLAAVVYDWDKSALQQLERILSISGARIVISSDWRNFGLDRMRGFLAIHGLDAYLYGALDGSMYCQTDDQKAAVAYYQSIKGEGQYFDYRAAEIRDYLDKHDEITAYVAIDDLRLGYPVDNHFVQTDSSLTKDDADKAIEILKVEDGPYRMQNRNEQS